MTLLRDLSIFWAMICFNIPCRGIKTIKALHKRAVSFIIGRVRM